MSSDTNIGTAVGRPCRVCSSGELREPIESAILTDPISAVSAQFNISISSLRRHRDNHLRVPTAALDAAGLSSTDIVSRIAEIADRLTDAADAAEDAGRHADHVRAADGARRAWESLLSLGLTHEDDLDALDLEAASRRVLARLAHRDPKLAELFAVEFDRLDRRALASDLRHIHNPTASLES